MPKPPESETNPSRSDLQTRFGTMQENALKAAKIAYDTRGTVLFPPEAPAVPKRINAPVEKGGILLTFDPSRRPRRSRNGF